MEQWWDALEGDFPLADEPDAERSAIVVGGAAVGMLQWSEELEPKYRSASIDIFVSATHHGRGWHDVLLMELVVEPDPE